MSEKYDPIRAAVTGCVAVTKISTEQAAVDMRDEADKIIREIELKEIEDLTLASAATIRFIDAEYALGQITREEAKLAVKSLGGGDDQPGSDSV